MEVGDVGGAGEEIPAGDLSAEDARRLEALRRRIKAHRELHAISQEEFAEKCGVSRSMIANVERGAYLPRKGARRKIASGLGVPPARLFDPPA